MKIIVFSVALALFSGAHAATRQLRAKESGWSPNPPGTAIAQEGASTAVGVGGAIAEHNSQISIQGGWEVPAIAQFSSGSNGGLSNSAYNYQSSAINSDGSSEAAQSNSASNSGYAGDFLYGEAQGENVDVNSQGWSAVEGEGAVSQVDNLEHVGGPAAPPPPPPAGWGWGSPNPARKP